MKKLFISQPMRDKTPEQIKAEREKAVKSAERELGEKVEVLDSYFECQSPMNVHGGIWYLGKSIMLLAKADVVYFCKDWENYRGCRVEHEVAMEYDVPLVIENYSK